MAARTDLHSAPRGNRSRGRRLHGRGAIAAAVTLAGTALAGAVGAGPAMAGPGPPAPSSGAASPATSSSASPSTSPGTRTGAGGGTGPGYATPAHTGFLKSRAAADHMGRSLSARSASSVSRAAVPLLATTAGPVYGNDVSSYQGNVSWGPVAAHHGQFSYIKATEGTYYTNPGFAGQYGGAYKAGLIRGAYAFAVPSYSGGASQADFFASHGGGWKAGSHTLPGALDIEYNPYGAQCYGLTHSSMVSWIRAFLNEYHARTGRWAVIYTTYNWWSGCTGNYGGFAATDPLWIARYASSAGTLPAGWSYYTFWQYADSGTFPGDQDVFNGAAGRLLALANNT